ncbi:SDR family NAD(P)-dependent oxidoreductase [Hydrogenophaga sp.]|uniref:SDR family NAD(P)-dependent oxidoreductase n=1 Tax=Hydrogenophaga sp. TaxID=1904254 RepID=UPI0027238985|nr:SDR family NAD(P)-dependent oxidoreductase [Hydrogenophaga sp.]MDO9435252.1 SDR family NAD(P)-dependent oxidoreductase [Hydrogenophaga sp.]
MSARLANAGNLFSVQGLRVIVTGSTRGIGLAIAQAFAAHGARVCITGRDGATASQVAQDLGGEAIGLALDVASEASVQAVAAQLQSQWGGLDVLVNNAGIDPHYASIESTDSAQWHEVLKTNLDGCFFACKHLGALMLPQGRGNVINISSVAGNTGLRRQVPYCASKGGVEQLTRALALDWADKGIRVNAIGYGFIRTALTAGMTAHPHIAPRLLARTPMGRFGEVSEVAGAALFLASPGASYVTGHSLMVDGGWSAA